MSRQRKPELNDALFNWLKPAQVAEALGIEKPEVMEMIRDGRLPSIDVARGSVPSFRVSREAVANEVARRGSPEPDWPKRDLDRGRVYLIETLEGPHRVKIGFTDSLERRMIGLRTACPVEVRVVTTWRGALADERAAHEALAQFRVRGEWFDATAVDALREFMRLRGLEERAP